MCAKCRIPPNACNVVSLATEQGVWTTQIADWSEIIWFVWREHCEIVCEWLTGFGGFRISLIAAHRFQCCDSRFCSENERYANESLLNRTNNTTFYGTQIVNSTLTNEHRKTTHNLYDYDACWNVEMKPFHHTTYTWAKESRLSLRYSQYSASNTMDNHICVPKVE